MNSYIIKIAKIIIHAANLIEEKGDEKNWCTPEVFLDLLYKFSPVRLDPCSNPTSLVKATEKWTPDTKYLPNGKKEKKTPEETFTTPWPKDGLTYVNPPYGKESDVFMEKMAKEGAEGAEIIALIPARVDTKRWHDFAEKADAILFWRGRISFINPKTKKVQTGTKFPSAVLYWGKNIDKFVEVFKEAGSIRLKPEGVEEEPLPNTSTEKYPGDIEEEQEEKDISEESPEENRDSKEDLEKED